MRALFFFLLPVLAFAAKGDPTFPEVSGYDFHGKFQVLQKRRYEIVYGFTDAGAARLVQLKREGHVCNLSQRDTYLCTINETLDGNYPGLAERVERKMEGKHYTFAPVRGAAELIRKSDAGAEWQMPQIAEIEGKTYWSYRFFLMSNGTQKLIFGDPTESALLMTDSGELQLPVELSVSATKQLYWRYIVAASLEKPQL